MSTPRSRFSRRHLLALCTFLAPLGVLAVLGQSELQRQVARIQASIGSEAKLFLDGAVQAFEQQIDRQRSTLLEESQQLIARDGALRATLQLRERGYAALLDIVVVDEQAELIWPQPPEPELGLPFARDPRGRGPETAISRGLNAADLLLTTGNYTGAEHLLQHLIGKLEKADETGRGQDVTARFRLATVHKKLGRLDEARDGFARVRDRVFPSEGRSPWRTFDELGVLAETALAEMGGVDDSIRLLERVTSDRDYSFLPDGLRTAVVERLVEGIPDSHALRPQLLGTLSEVRQYARTRAFAGDYYILLRTDLRRLLRQRAEQEPGDLHIVATLGEATTMFWVRAATEAEQERYRGATRIGLHLDLDLLLAPALEQFVAGDPSFRLAVRGPGDVWLAPAPPRVPEGFLPPTQRIYEMDLSAWPADAARLLAETDAQARNRFLLLLALFGAAMVGALWLWRSVSREAELAALKVDLVSRVSHELKTPLALIRMYGETLVLGRARDSEQAQHFGGIIARESERLTTMIQRILDFSRQQAGTLTYTRTRVELGALLRRIADAYSLHLESHGAVLEDTLHREAYVDCDESACESAVVNLLENAVKYAIGGDDEHVIELDLLTEGGFAVVEVRDRGRGVPADECEHVFDPFYRASNSGEVRGAGIGLSLVRHFARAHGGDTTAHPRADGGVVLRLTLPLAKPGSP